MAQPEQPRAQPPQWQPTGYPPPGYGYPGYGPPPPGYGPPPGNIGWAIVALIMFWPLAIPAFISYSKVESSFYRGDYAGALQASNDVKRFGIIALVVGLVLLAFVIIFAFAVLSSVSVM